MGDNAKIIRRERRHRDGDGDKRRHRREGRAHARDHHDGARQFRPKATPKYAYDADGNYRVYDGNGWDGKGRGKSWDRRKNWYRWNDWNDWDHKKRPRIHKLHSFGFQEPAPSLALKDILTAVPD